MKKLITVEFDKKSELVELHLNKEGAEYLRNILNKLIQTDQSEDIHLMTPTWGERN